MAEDTFRFRQFCVRQELCAMKVGTDGVMLGAWADVEFSRRVLDIGCGTGLIALMVAQRNSQAEIVAIDIDEPAVAQSLDNVSHSPWADRINVVHSSLQQYEGRPFDAIVCNPPFFDESLRSPSEQRNTARHTDSLSFSELFTHVRRLLLPSGVFSMVIPFDKLEKIYLESAVCGFTVRDSVVISTRPGKRPKRALLTFVLSSAGNTTACNQCLENPDGTRSDWYAQLTADYYLH